MLILVFEPGKISKDFIENRRARYTPPIRLFFFTLAFFIIAIEFAQHEMVIRRVQNRGSVILNEQVHTLPDSFRIAFTNPYFTGRKVIYSVAELKEIKNLPFGETANWLKAHQRPDNLIYRFHLSYIKQNINSTYSVENFQRRVVKVNYWLILLIIPFSAFLNYVFFYRKKLMYYDSMVLTIHIYTYSQVQGIILCLLSIFLLKYSLIHDTSLILFTDYFMSLLLNMLPAYKRVYEFSWPSTILRAILLSIVHLSSYIFMFWALVAIGLF